MEKSIEKDFVERTIHILHNYDGPYGVTLLINCLLGLIVLPKERDYNHISEKNGVTFADLGIDTGVVKSWGRICEEERTAARFIRCMRNSIAHIKIESLGKEKEIEFLRFSDESGFEAILGIDELKQMVLHLADYIH